jgi:formylglycine-generating enzyme required for sulfatase activity
MPALPILRWSAESIARHWTDPGARRAHGDGRFLQGCRGHRVDDGERFRPRSSSRQVLLGAALLAVVALVVVVLGTRPTDERGFVQRNLEEEIGLIRQNAASGDWTRLAEVLDGQMVTVPAGDFLMGSDRDRPDERPQHRVYLDAFEIDRYEVTNAQYRRFAETAGEAPPPHWQNGRYAEGQEDYPVVGVSWPEADAYCRWAGKRLPTEAEWEKACRGTDGRTYPWGNRWDPGRLNVDLTRHIPRTAGDEVFSWQDAWALLQGGSVSDTQPWLQPVGSYAAGASPYGMLDASGNASEWVADWYNWAGYGNLPDRNPLVTGPPWNHCVRGSAWYDPLGARSWAQSMSRCSARNSSHEVRDPRTGFRCARSVPQRLPQ